MNGCILVAWLTLAFAMPTHSCATLPDGAAGYGASGPAPGPQIWVAQPWLAGLRRGIGLVTTLRAEQVFVIAHELGHAHGAATEPGANAWARTHWGYVVRALGAGPTKARLLWHALPTEWKELA